MCLAMACSLNGESRRLLSVVVPVRVGSGQLEGNEMRAREIAVDERGRTSLARVRTKIFDRYLVEEYPDGTLILTPAVTVAVNLVAVPA